jgi:short-subunit dehydrogenase
LEKTGAKILELDYLDESTIEKAAVAYGSKPLDFLINVGGLSPHPKPWNEQTNDMLVEKFRVMAVGPLLTIKHFLPKLEQSPNAKVVNISSAFGSISSAFVPDLSAVLKLSDTQNPTQPTHSALVWPTAWPNAP